MMSPTHAMTAIFSQRLKRGVLYGAAIVTLLIAVIGLLHTSVGRPILTRSLVPLLAKLGVACPITKATPQQIDHARTIPAAAYLGKPKAPARPAFGFTFEKTTLADMQAWAQQNHIDCDKLNGNETLRACKNVPASALGEPASFPAAEEVDFEFRAARTLAVVSVLRRGLSVQQANAMAAAASTKLRQTLGAPQKTAGDNSAAHFAKGPLQAYQEEYEFGDYGATLTETRLGNTGLLLREHYFSPVL
jgi:hypothetical protein